MIPETPNHLVSSIPKRLLSRNEKEWQWSYKYFTVPIFFLMCRMNHNWNMSYFEKNKKKNVCNVTQVKFCFPFDFNLTYRPSFFWFRIVFGQVLHF